MVPLAGGKARQVTRQRPSNLHGWSLGGKSLIYSGERKGKRDIYTIALEGGAESRLTNGEGRNENAQFFHRRQARLLQLRPRPLDSDKGTTRVPQDQEVMVRVILLEAGGERWNRRRGRDGRRVEYVSYQMVPVIR